MPFYDYIEEASGQEVELLVPIAERDDVTGHRRLAVPPRVNTVGFAPDIHSQEYQTRKGLKDLEEKVGRDRIERESGFTVTQLKSAWAEN